VDFSVRPPVGLLGGRKLVILTSTGGQYTPGSPTAGFDFQEPYLRHIFGVLGLKDPTVIHADRQLYGPEVAALAQREAIEQVDRLVPELKKTAA
ncbi:MAG TPA: NAD(P)H-dependent oxidoreductase, partial [Gammaproteobacteria bacterium]|jgi:FMN-dependent NADH-azoreductase